MNLKAWQSFETLRTTQLPMAEHPARFKSSSNNLLPLYQLTCHHVPDICTKDTHKGKKLQSHVCE
jgi:hypothetical protein